jgi:transposase
MLSIGLDVHQKSTALCELDANGRLSHERVIHGGFAAVAEHLGSIKEPFKVCFEASCGYGTLHDLLTPLAQEVQVAHPTELKLIFRSKHKNDRSDARKIAKLLYMDEIPAVHVPSIDVRAWRGLIEHRRRLVDKRTRAKNALRAQLRGLGIKCPSRHALWSAKGIEWVKAQELPTTLDRLKRSSLLAELEVLNAQVKIVRKELDAVGAKDWRVVLLRTVPGVGPLTAEAVAAYIDDPDRFTSIKSIGKYFGIVPWQNASAGKNRLGHITREGPSTVRMLITQAAWQAVRRSAQMAAFFERVKAGQKQRTGVAVVAVGHKLLRIMLAMLRSKEPWRAEPKPNIQSVPTSGAALPAAASANCTQTQQPRRRGRGKGSSLED